MISTNKQLSYKNSADFLLGFIVRLPVTLKRSFLYTFVAGLATHLFFYTNIFFAQDSAALYYESNNGASGSRWAMSAVFSLFEGFNIPWAEGLFLLLVYSFCAWLVCEIFSVTQPVLVFLISALLITSPTAISTHFYLSSAHIFSLALLFSVLGVYCFRKLKYGIVLSFICLLFSSGLYAGYISFYVSLFLMTGLLDALFKKEPAKKLFFKQIISAVVVFAVMLFSYFLTVIGTKAVGGELRSDIASVTTHDFFWYLDAIVDTYIKTVSFLLGRSASLLSGFHLLAFALGILACLLACFYFALKCKLFKSPGHLALLFLNLLLLPLGMDIINVLSKSHTLMQFAMICPWIFLVVIVNKIDVRFIDVLKKKIFLLAISWVILASCFLTVFFNWRIANIAYLKAYTVYTNGISVMTRIIDRVEEQPRYTVGKTPVVFIGNPTYQYSHLDEEFSEFIGAIAGIGTFSVPDIGLPFYNFAFSSVPSFDAYLTQHLNTNINVAAITKTLDNVDEMLQKIGITKSKEEFVKEIGEMSAFPAQGCVKEIEGTLFVKLSN